jgi:hydroxymethylbilane synthase
VATGSPRRAAQLHLLRPDLRTVEIRGNVETRIRRLSQGEADAAVLAAAGLERLDMTAEIAETLGTDEMVPAPGQGALAVEARAGTFGAEVARGFDDPALRELLTAERSLLANTGAGCRSALGALAVREAGRIVMTTFVSDDRGPRRSRVTGDSADEVVSLAMAELGL